MNQNDLVAKVEAHGLDVRMNDAVFTETVNGCCNPMCLLEFVVTSIMMLL